MKRRILGAAIASATAPFSVMVFLTVLDLFLQGDGQPLWGRGNFINIIPYGFIALFLFAIPLALLALIGGLLGLALERLGFLSPLPYIVCGALTGLGFLVFVMEGSLLPPDNWPGFAICLSGALCGWIYWRIALRGRSPDGSADCKRGV